jgi:hypothetical protein
LAFGIWHLAFGIWHLAFGIWHLAFGIWHLAFGIYSRLNERSCCFFLSALQRSCCGVFNENKKLRTAAHQQISDALRACPSPTSRAALPLAEARQGQGSSFCEGREGCIKKKDFK